ncbi:hypothetical protein [Occallatibacter savannae]|uniref:hypothetical protein n=1 Tax=Occallatibacter savannae TaxID=1002691 RepID=UPI000D69AC74|nr:hypothetical protein [Occallatibacter savannae]
MRKFIWISLLINIFVLIPVCFGLISNASWAQQAYGQASPARGILLSIYMAICAVSVFLLFRPDPLLVAPLLLVQVVYKVTTPFTVGTISNPVVISNLVIAAVHTVTLLLILRTIDSPAHL